MKTLYINRHAKASFARDGSRDFDRVLDDRGIEDARIMGRRLKQRDGAPDLFVTSSAVRALSTARLIAKEVHYPLDDIAENRQIYNADIGTLLRVINSLDDSDDTVILFGHNLGFSEIIGYLTGQGIGTLPPCGIAKIDFENLDRWAEVSKGTGSLAYFDHPEKSI